jgi:hypothetical protein
MEKPILNENVMFEKNLFFALFYRLVKKNVRFITRADPPPLYTLDKPFFFALENKCVKTISL